MFHTASCVTKSDESTQLANNVLGTQVLLTCAAEIESVQAMVYTSCCEGTEFEPSNKILTEESSKLCSKESAATPSQKATGIAETLVLTANSSRLRTLALRLPPIYGGDDPDVVPGLLEMMARGKCSIQIGQNEKVFEHLYIDNAISAHLLAAKYLLQSHAGEGVDGESFFITDGTPMPWYDFARKVWYAAGDRTQPQDLRTVPMSLALASASVNDWVSWAASMGRTKPEVTSADMAQLQNGTWFSIEKAKRLLGYEPVVTADEGIKRAVEASIEGKGADILGARSRLV